MITLWGQVFEYDLIFFLHFFGIFLSPHTAFAGKCSSCVVFYSTNSSPEQQCHRPALCVYCKRFHTKSTVRTRRQDWRCAADFPVICARMSCARFRWRWNINSSGSGPDRNGTDPPPHLLHWARTLFPAAESEMTANSRYKSRAPRSGKLIDQLLQLLSWHFCTNPHVLTPSPALDTAAGWNLTHLERVCWNLASCHRGCSGKRRNEMLVLATAYFYKIKASRCVPPAWPSLFFFEAAYMRLPLCCLHRQCLHIISYYFGLLSFYGSCVHIWKRELRQWVK